MTKRVDAIPGPRGLERVLRSRAGRVLLAAALVLIAATFTSENVHEVFERRRLEVSWWRVFLPQLALWAGWGLAAWPLAALSRALWRRVPVWPLFVALQLPLGVGAAIGFTTAQAALEQEILDPVLEPLGRPERDGPRADRRPFRPGPAPRRPEAQRPSPPRRMEDERWPFGGLFLARARLQFAAYWIVLGISAGVAAFLSSREREREATSLALRAARLETELARAELGSLRDQLRPHFLFNALHTVGALVQQSRAQEAARVLAALGDLLRSTLEVGERQEMPLSEELLVTERYLEVERARLGERLELETEVEAGCSAALVPALLLQPLLENAVRHGIAPKPDGGRIGLAVRRDGEALVIELTDDGPGFPAHVLAGGTGSEPGRRRPSIGLANARERLRLLYGGAHSLELENGPDGGARVRVRVPYHTTPVAGHA